MTTRNNRPNRVERRVLQNCDLELRVATEDSEDIISGYAARFSKWSEDLGGFKEKIKPGAFKKALKSSDVRALINHDPNYVLGRTAAGTLRLTEDSKGLYMEVGLPDTQFARDLKTSIQRGDITGQSFGFVVAEEGSDWKEDKSTGEITRTINEIEELFDVSIVTFPAYTDTDVALRYLDEWRVSNPGIETDDNKTVQTHIDRLGHKRLRFARRKLNMKGIE